MNHSVSAKYGVMRLASSHLKTHVSLLSLRLTQGKRGFRSLLKHPLYIFIYMMAAPLCIRNCSCRIISLRVPPPPRSEDRGHTLELVQTSGVQRHKIIKRGSNLDLDTLTVFMVRLETFNFQKLKHIIILDISRYNSSPELGLS